MTKGGASIALTPEREGSCGFLQGPEFPVPDLISMKVLPPPPELKPSSFLFDSGRVEESQFYHSTDMPWESGHQPSAAFHPPAYSPELESMKKKLMPFTTKTLPISSLKGLSYSYLEFFFNFLFFTHQELLPGERHTGDAAGVFLTETLRPPSGVRRPEFKS